MAPAFGAALSAVAAALAWGAGALTRSGAIAAALVGTAVLTGGGWAGAAPLATFFLSATLLGRIGKDRAAATGEAKGSTRDAGQVLANGGAAALSALLAWIEPALAQWAIAGAFAAAAADTWATSVGGTSPRPPQDLFTGHPVAAGTSGGVTLRGTVAAGGGALLVAAVTALVSGDRRLILPVTTIGWIGMLIDSAVGSSLQARFHCPRCDAPTERAIHRCGTPTVHVRGWRLLDNDGVNAVATVTAALLGALAWRAFGAGR